MFNPNLQTSWRRFVWIVCNPQLQSTLTVQWYIKLTVTFTRNEMESNVCLIFTNYIYIRINNFNLFMYDGLRHYKNTKINKNERSFRQLTI